MLKRSYRKGAAFAELLDNLDDRATFVKLLDSILGDSKLGDE